MILSKLHDFTLVLRILEICCLLTPYSIDKLPPFSNGIIVIIILIIIIVCLSSMKKILIADILWT